MEAIGLLRHLENRDDLLHLFNSGGSGDLVFILLLGAEDEGGSDLGGSHVRQNLDLERFEGDEMPTESEFVASLDARKGKRKVPQLEATEEQLAKFPAPQVPTKATEQQPVPAPTATRYPPLESSTR